MGMNHAADISVAGMDPPQEECGMIKLTFWSDAKRPTINLMMKHHQFETWLKQLRLNVGARLCGTSLCPIEMSVFTKH